MNDDDQRMHEVLRSWGREQRSRAETLPFLPPLLSDDGGRSSYRRYASIAAVVAFVAAVPVTLGLLTTRSDKSVSPASSLSPTAGARHVPVETLNKLAKQAPCESTRIAANTADRAKVADFRPVAVIECTYDNLVIAGSGTWAVLIRQVSDTGLNNLQTVLSQPNSTKSPPGGVCAGVGHVPLPLLFADASGRYIQPPRPHDYCDFSLPGVEETIERVVWRTVLITKLHRAQSDGPPTDGCGLDTRSAVQQARSRTAKSAARAALLQQPPGRLTACFYYSLDDQGDGRLSRFLKITPPYFEPVVTALSGALPRAGRKCPTQNEFAIIHDTHGNSLTLEMGGCWRVATDGSSPFVIGTANPAQTIPLLAATTSGSR